MERKQNLERASEFWMFPHGSSSLNQKNQGDWVERASERKRPTRYRNNRRKRIDFWGASLFARRWTWYPQFHQANRTSNVTKIAWLQSFRLLLLGLRSRGPCYPFGTIDELKRIIRDAWNECATDLSQIRKTMKQFLPRLEAVDAKEGGSIKTFFG